MKFAAESDYLGKHRVVIREDYAPGFSATWTIAERVDSRERAELIARLLEEHARG